MEKPAVASLNPLKDAFAMPANRRDAFDDFMGLSEDLEGAFAIGMEQLQVATPTTHISLKM